VTEEDSEIGSPGRKQIPSLIRTRSLPDFCEIMKQAEKVFF